MSFDSSGNSTTVSNNLLSPSINPSSDECGVYLDDTNFRYASLGFSSYLRINSIRCLLYKLIGIIRYLDQRKHSIVFQ